MLKYSNNHKKYNKIKLSYGTICYRTINETIEYLLVKRKYSYAFTDFLFGKYKLSDIEYLITLFSRMAPQEKLNILTLTFNELWILVWSNYQQIYEFNYNQGKIRFEILQRGYIFDDRSYNFIELIKLSSDKYLTCEWGFPKGKKNSKDESDEHCAIREFMEETGVKSGFKINRQMQKIYEAHTGINKIYYKTFLYFLEFSGSIDTSLVDKAEISDLRWFTRNEISNRIRDYQHSIFKAIDIAENNILVNNKNNHVAFNKFLRQRQQISNFQREFSYISLKKMDNELDEEKLAFSNDINHIDLLLNSSLKPPGLTNQKPLVPIPKEEDVVVAVKKEEKEESYDYSAFRGFMALSDEDSEDEF